MKLLPIFENGTVDVPELAHTEVIASVLDATVAMYRRSGYQPPWIGYLALESEQVVGTCGFTSPPKSGEVELAYFTFPAHEGMGIAGRMAQALLLRAREFSDAITVIIAHTLPQEGASPAILRKLGFVLQGDVELAEDGRVWKWCLRMA